MHGVCLDLQGCLAWMAFRVSSLLQAGESSEYNILIATRKLPVSDLLEIAAASLVSCTARLSDLLTHGTIIDCD